MPHAVQQQRKSFQLISRFYRNGLELPIRRNPLAVPDPSLARLDAGERDAIALATELQADQLIVDAREGRREAERRGIPAIGTLGVLREATTLKLLDIRVAVGRLQATSFYVAPEVLAELAKDFT